jgi:hypothetical protein
MKKTHAAKHQCLSYMKAAVLEYRHKYTQDCYKNNFEEVEIPFNTKKLAFVK